MCCSIRYAASGPFSPHFRPDVFTTWNAAGPRLRTFLTRKDDRILCPELGTAYEAA
jgi:hypothetical protein